MPEFDRLIEVNDWVELEFVRRESTPELLMKPSRRPATEDLLVESVETWQTRTVFRGTVSLTEQQRLVRDAVGDVCADFDAAYWREKDVASGRLRQKSAPAMPQATATQVAIGGQPAVLLGVSLGTELATRVELVRKSDGASSASIARAEVNSGSTRR